METDVISESLVVPSDVDETVSILLRLSIQTLLSHCEDSVLRHSSHLL